MTVVQVEIVLGTVVAGAGVVLAGWWARRRVHQPTPGATRVLWEISLERAERAAASVPAEVRPRVVNIAVTIFWFVAAANWLHLIPGLSLPSPTSDINLTVALAVVAMSAVHLTALQVRGWRGYFRQYLSPWWLAPLKILDELIKPVTLSLRLFGMVFASGLMLLLIGELMPAPVAVVPHALWTVFDVFVGAIQAFIFALLTILYFTAVLPVTAPDKRPTAPPLPSRS